MEQFLELDQLEKQYELLYNLITQYGINTLWAILTLLLGWTVAKWAKRRVKNAIIASQSIDTTLAPVLGRITHITIILLTLVMVLSQFGVQTASFVALLGAAGLTIGLALQGTLSNVASGVMLLVFRPFKIGQFVNIGGIAGTVKEIGLFITELTTSDNVNIYLPNSRVWGQEIRNFSQNERRRHDLKVGISYGDDINKAFAAIQSVLDADERVIRDPEPFVYVDNLGDSSVDLSARFWVAAPDYWKVKWDLTKAIKEKLDAEGISIPFPQRDVHLFTQEKV